MKLFKIMGLMPVLCFCACSEVEQPEHSPEYITFSPAVTVSRATDTAFDRNDKISVFAEIDNGYNTSGSIGSNPYAHNVPYSYNGSKFIAMSEGIELEHADDKLFYYAVYPYSADMQREFTFLCKHDQSDYTDYTLSDLMVAYNDESTSSQSVSLKFIHILSKAVVNLEYSGIEVYRVTLTDVNYAANLNMEKNTIATLSAKGDVVMCPNGNKSFKAIIPYQTIKEGTAFAMIETNIGNYRVTASNDIELDLAELKNIYVRIDNTKRGNSKSCNAYTK
ncbi:fimbrillin family protein [Bacteroides sp. ET489]|uniref:fimbrillin family protein n=1 Tax=Bacteroides sp. ET489 TaxID=3057126 RepID=UPI0026711B35|nr:fimbrillin family protein [Bacteroides sp. ET489]MDO3390407.1 fimbrillin family protein [Bacteroides sp. ET489]